MSNQGWKIKAETININSNEPFPYHYSILVSKCRGILNNINNPYAKLWFPCVIKDINIKVFNLMSRTNETRYIEWHETCACKCRLNEVFVIKATLECKKLIVKGRYNNGFIWNPSICECECDKSYNIGRYLDYKNCICRK